MSKYAGRSLPSFTRTQDEFELEELFASNMEKLSVEPMRNKSIYEQISSVMGIKSKYPTVSAAVEDMKERAGFNTFLKKMEEQLHNVKKAEQSVALFEKVPQIKQTTDNYIIDTYGNLPIPAVLYRLKQIHKNDVKEQSDWNQEALLDYIANKTVEVKKMHPLIESGMSNLGKLPISTDVDADNVEVFHSLNPNSLDNK